MCSMVNARRPPTIALQPNRCAATVPTSTRPAVTSKGRSVTATSRWRSKSSMTAPSPSANSISGARNVTPIAAGSAIGTGASGAFPKPMMSNSISALS